MQMNDEVGLIKESLEEYVSDQALEQIIRGDTI